MQEGIWGRSEVGNWHSLPSVPLCPLSPPMGIALTAPFSPLSCPADLPALPVLQSAAPAG